MRSQFHLLLALAILVVGCRRKVQPAEAPPAPAPQEEKAAEPTPAASAATPTTPAAEQPPPDPSQAVKDSMPTAPNDSGLVKGATHLPLTEALHRYFEAKGQLPQNFQQLVTAKFIEKLPPAPPGKKFAIDRRNLQVVLVNQ